MNKSGSSVVDAGDTTEQGAVRAPLVKRHFSDGIHPFEAVQWELRDAVLGKPEAPVFEQRGIEFPADWSQNATNIVAQKYFRGKMNSPERERSVKTMVSRVADTITRWGREGGYFATDEEAETFNHELSYLLVTQRMAFNSPVWFNCGHEETPQCSACQPWDALVSTPSGMVPIGELVEADATGREVYDASGITRIVATKHNGRKPVYRVKLRNGSYVEATADHVVKAVQERRTAPQWRRVDELLPGMRMHLHPHRAKVADVARVAVGVGSRNDAAALEVMVQQPSTAEAQAISEAALAGWLQADGFVGLYTEGTNKSLTIEFLVATEDEFEWVSRHLDVVFPDVHRKVRDADTKTPVQRIRLYGEVLREFVERWGLLTRGVDIRVPRDLWTASTEEISAYLSSIFQADGYVSVAPNDVGGTARVGFAVISERWTEDVQNLLASIGIYARRTHKREPRTDRHDMHEVAISIGSERARFAELVGFPCQTKQRKLLQSLDLESSKVCPDLREEEIVEIVELGEREVYDIQTESGEYLTNNVAVHNCFILSVDDSMDDILEWIREEGLIFKGGSGSGVNLSRLRSSAEQLSKGGHASGPVSFMRGADASAGTIKSGGKTRRAAKMVVLNIDHPDIQEFIWCKSVEEEKARALAAAGFDMALDSPHWHSIQYQNANNSVRVNDEFMRAVVDDTEFSTRAVTTGEAVETFRARDLMQQMADAAWRCADPGVQYDTTINHWHTTPKSGRINGSNPCSEYMHVDNSACNLASLNLLKFVDERGHFDIDAYEQAIDVTITAQEIIVGFSSYPTQKITDNAMKMRQLGIGYANLGALLMNEGLPYDSDEGRSWAGALTAVLTGRAYRQSARIAERMGAYEAFGENAEEHLRVMEQHRAAIGNIEQSVVPDHVMHAARRSWDEAIQLGREHGYRNAQASVLAPTGTISFMMDCDTTGIEPDFSLVKQKKLVGGGDMTIVNQTVPHALAKLGYATHEVDQIVAWVAENYSVVGAPFLKEEHYAIFDCAVGARSITYMGHVKMMAAAQPFISGAISKTVNMPEESTIDDIVDLYTEAWKLGIKAVAIYRDGSKHAQPLASSKDESAQEPIATLTQPVRRRLPLERQGIGRKFQVGEYTGYIHVGLFEDGTPGDMFVDIAKEGTTLAGLMNSLMISVSLGLQYGVPLEVYVQRFSHMRFEPSGFTNDEDIRNAKSIVDYIFRWMGKKFLTADQQMELGILTPEVRARLAAGYSAAEASPPMVNPYTAAAATAAAGVEVGASVERPASPGAGQSPLFNAYGDAQECARCGGRMIRTGACYTCTDCGNNTGCG